MNKKNVNALKLAKIITSAAKKIFLSLVFTVSLVWENNSRTIDISTLKSIAVEIYLNFIL